MAQPSRTTSEFNLCQCPITHQLFQDPVVAEDGYTYERKAIVNWINTNGTSPVTRQPLSINQLRPNLTIKNMVDEFRTKNFYFKLDTHIKKKSRRALFQAHGKTVWEAEWIGQNGPPICLMKINGAKALKEASFYETMTRHPYIVKTYGFVEEPTDITSNSITLLQEYAGEGNLFELLQEQRSVLQQSVLCEMFIQISDAMVFLAHNQIIHGDLACRNVLVFRYDPNESKNNLVKITDFGLSRGSSIYAPAGSGSTTTLTIVPIRYAAPEVLSNSNERNSYTTKSDMFSMGVLMWEGYTKGEMPWSQIENDNEVSRKVINGERLPKPEKCSEQMWSVLLKCMSQQPNDRPSFEDLKRQLLGFVTNPLENSNVCIGVAHDENHEIIQIPLTEQTYVSLATLNLQFPGMIGLKYRSSQTNEWITISLLESNFQLPQNEPISTTYIALYSGKFTDADLMKYVHTFFTTPGVNRARPLLAFLKNQPKIWNIAHEPIILGFICNLWKSDHSPTVEHMTLTQLYNSIIRNFLRRHLESQELDTSYMDNDEIDDKCKLEVQFLQIIAFEGIKVNSIVLKREVIQNALKRIEPDPNKRTVIVERVIKIGILKYNTIEQLYSFSHLSLQQYFAAQFLVNNLIDNDNYTIQFIKTQKYSKLLLLLFNFMAGLISEKQSSAYMQIFWNTLGGQPLDMIGIRHMELIISCTDEVDDKRLISNYDLLLNKIGDVFKLCFSNQRLVCSRIIDLLKQYPSIQQPQLINNILLYAITMNEDWTARLIVESLIETAVTPELINIVIRTMNNGNNSVLGELIKTKLTTDLVHAVLPLFKHQESKVRDSICSALRSSIQNRSSPAIIACLIRALNNEDNDIKQYIALVLGDLDDEVVDIEVINGLLRALSNSNENVRQNAALSLGELANEIAIQDIINALLVALKDRNENVRKNAASAFGRLGTKAAQREVISELLRAINDQNIDVRKNAISALGKLGQEITTIEIIRKILLTLEDTNSDVTSEVTSTLENLISEDSSSEIINLLIRNLKGNNNSIKLAAASALGSLGDRKAWPQVIDGLLSILEENNDALSWRVVGSLEKIINAATISKAVTRLLKMLPMASIRPPVYTCLKYLAEHKSTPELVRLVLETMKHPDREVRSNALFLIGKLGEKWASPNLVNILVSTLRNSNEYERSSIELPLRMIVDTTSSTEIIHILADLLTSNNDLLRKSGMSIQEMITNETVIVELIKRLIQIAQHSNQSVRLKISQTLEKIHVKIVSSKTITTLVSTLQNSSAEVKCRIILLLQKLLEKRVMPEGINGLRQYLNDPNPNVRETATSAVTSIEDHNDISKIIDRLLEKLNSVNGNDATDAAGQLEKLGIAAAKPEVIIGLLNTIKDRSDVAWRAAYALEILFKKNPSPELINVLMQPTWNRHSRVRCEIIRALEGLNGKNTSLELINWLIVELNSESDHHIERKIFRVLNDLQLPSSVLSTLNNNILTKLIEFKIGLRSTLLLELIKTYLQTSNDNWLSIIYNEALYRETAVIILAEKLIIFNNQNTSDELDISNFKTSGTLDTFIQSMGNRANASCLQCN